MVNQLIKISPVKLSFDYIKDVYQPCLERYLQHPKNISHVLSSINNGRKILQSNQEVDTYIAFYGAHHYYKLVEAFDALNMSRFCNEELEIISYGCGAATDTCSLISYCREKEIDLPSKYLTLIEPSKIALDRGVEYIEKALSSEKFNKINIKKIYKTIQDLKENDLNSDSKISKLHVFSNVLDIKEINLNNLVSLINKTQSGTNYFICINPKNLEGKSRIDYFYNKLSELFELSDLSINAQEIKNKKIWIMKNNKYIDNHLISRYHRIYYTNIR